MIAHYANGNVLTVKKALRHKNILNTINTSIRFRNLRNDFEETTATTPEEIRRLGKEGWTKYDEMTINDVQIHFYRKLRCFGGF